MFELKKSQPLYMQLAAQLREKILSGELKPGEQMPSQEHIAAESGVAGYTVNEAFNVLAAEGLIRSIPKRGRFVQPRSQWKSQEQQ